MKQTYTNKEKLEYYRQKYYSLKGKLEYFLKRIKELEQLPPDETTDQNWDSELQSSLDQRKSR